VFAVKPGSTVVQVLILPPAPDNEMPQSEIDRIRGALDALSPFGRLGPVVVEAFRQPDEVAPEPEDKAGQLLGIGIMPWIFINVGAAVVILVAALVVLLLWRRRALSQAQAIAPDSAQQQQQQQQQGADRDPLLGNNAVAEAWENKPSPRKPAKVAPEPIPNDEVKPTTRSEPEISSLSDAEEADNIN
jgi:predicted lipid-binding transport protein (Tim44 family)